MLTEEQKEYIKNKYNEEINDNGAFSDRVYGYEAALVMILKMLEEKIYGINE